MANVYGRDVGAAQSSVDRTTNSLNAASALCGRGSVDVAISQYASDDVRSASLGMFPAFQHEGAGTFADNAAIAIGVKGPARRLRVIMPMRPRAVATIHDPS